MGWPMETITVESITIIVGREEDGRWWADIESMPGVMTYGENQGELAISAVRTPALASALAADCIEHGEETQNRLPKPSRPRGMSKWRSVKAKQLARRLATDQWEVAWQKGMLITKRSESGKLHAYVSRQRGIRKTLLALHRCSSYRPAPGGSLVQTASE